MQDISDLIKEAKPLYFARKRRNLQIKTFAAMLVCVTFLSALWPQSQKADVVSFWDLGEADSSMVTYVENFGLPVDDYGLLLVS